MKCLMICHHQLLGICLIVCGILWIVAWFCYTRSPRMGLLLEPSGTNYFLDSDHPASQKIDLEKGTYTFWIDGPGSTGIIIPTIVHIGFATKNNPLTFTLLNPSTIKCVVEGEPVRVQLEDSPIRTSYISTSHFQLGYDLFGPMHIEIKSRFPQWNFPLKTEIQ